MSEAIETIKEKTREVFPTEKLVQIQVLVDRCRSDAEIAAATDIPVEKVSALIASEGWREAHLLDPQQAGIAEANRKVMLKRWERAVGAMARWQSMEGFRMVENAQTPRDFKDAAAGTKLLVDMAREAEGMNNNKEAPLVGSGINLFYIERPEKPPEKNVTEI